MTQIINPTWKNAIDTQIRDFLDTSKPRSEIVKTLKWNQAVQWLIVRLTEANIPFKVINLGAGVKQVTTVVDTCPKCHGTGKC